MKKPAPLAPEAGELPTLARLMEHARMLRQTEAWTEAEFHYRRVLELAPDHARAWDELAGVLDAQGAVAAAAQARKQAGESEIAQATATAASLIGTPLQARASAILQKAARAHPSLASGPLALAELFRRLGDLKAAGEAARACLHLEPANARALSIATTLDGFAPPPSDLFIPAAPVWVHDRFLAQETHDRLFDLALGNADRLVPSIVGGADRHENWRKSKIDLKPVQASEILLPLILGAVTESVARFDMDPFDIGSTEMQLTVHNDGDFYRKHRDRGSDETDNRRISYVYYLHSQPRAFSGGGLRLFDTMRESGHCVEHAYTCVEPVDNRLVLFPSYVWHEVEMVRCPSGSYADGRFTLNGWIGVARG